MRKWQAALNIIGIGWFIGLSILLGLMGGLWLDNTLNTQPLFIIIGLLFGFIIAIFGIYKMLLPLLKNKESKEDT
ncbi:MAG: AtpZ/AtpI family protein [Dehalococcoidia bacterium]|nr:MAG: AtpZ/AtpI family protein [Dehalococcoidia bacterium]